jgi:membrane protease subunit HflK
MNIGNIAAQKSAALLWTKSHGTEEPFLTGDNNFFYPYIVLHYRIEDPVAYLYRNADPEGLLDAASHRIATLLFAHQTFYDIASINRDTLNREMFAELQDALADLDTGIELVGVNFKDMHPPISVAGSFEKVVAGYQEKQEAINDATGYQYSTIPNARGKAVKETEAAQGYIVDRVKSAEGEASRFVMSLPVTARQKEVSMGRIRLDAVREALQGKKTIVIDPKTGTSDIWMDFEGFFQNNSDAGNKEGGAS